MIDQKRIDDFEQILSLVKRGHDNTHSAEMEYKYNFNEDESYARIKFGDYGEIEVKGWDDFVLITAQHNVVEFAKRLKANLQKEQYGGNVN